MPVCLVVDNWYHRYSDFFYTKRSPWSLSSVTCHEFEALNPNFSVLRCGCSTHLGVHRIHVTGSRLSTGSIQQLLWVPDFCPDDARRLDFSGDFEKDSGDSFHSAWEKHSLTFQVSGRMLEVHHFRGCKMNRSFRGLIFLCTTKAPWLSAGSLLI